LKEKIIEKPSASIVVVVGQNPSKSQVVTGSSVETTLLNPLGMTTIIILIGFFDLDLLGHDAWRK